MDRTKKLNICFSVIFDCYDQSFISWRETGHYTLPLLKLEIFLIPNSPALLTVNQTYTKMLRCSIMFFLRLSENFSFALKIFNNDSSFWSSPLFKKESFIEKSTFKQSWRLSNVTFWRKLNMRNNVYRKLLNLYNRGSRKSMRFETSMIWSKPKNQHWNEENTSTIEIFSGISLWL